MVSDERQQVENDEDASAPVMGRGVRTAIIAVGGGAALFAVASIAFDSGFLRDRGEAPKGPEMAQAQLFQPPPESSIPSGPAGDAVRRGQAIFVNTASNAGDFVGNGLACASCHIDSGRRADSAPMWAAWVAYPKYRSKNKQINTMEDRIKGCFTYSMNAQASKTGGPPPPGDAVYKDLQTYMHWLATGAPTATDMPGAGYPKLEKTSLGYDPARGQKVFEARCVACHGVDGAGQTDINGRIVFPPLWGPNSYNWGAGMARVNTAAGFIKANMPLGQGNSLTDQQAWDVAAYIDSQERPKDPRQTGSIQDNAKANHGGDSYYGKRIGGRLAGVGTP